MSYLHIENLYKNQTILMFKECYAMEKIHGTSAHIRYVHKNDTEPSKLSFFAGGSNYENFVKLFDVKSLQSLLDAKGMVEEVYIYGESYGGKMQGMRATYGDDLKFVVFEVKIGDCWLSVPKAEIFTHELGLDFVAYEKVPATIEALNIERDKDSVQAVKNGCGIGHIREGIVIRPLEEFTTNNGERVIAKHKRDEFRETASPRVVGEENPQLTEAKSIANEWVTEERLTHVISGNNIELELKNIPIVIRLMNDDIIREAGNEIVVTKECISELNRATALMFKRRATKISSNE